MQILRRPRIHTALARRGAAGPYSADSTSAPASRERHGDARGVAANTWHPCREYWGQDIAYGSLVTGERPRRAERRPHPTEVLDPGHCCGDARALTATPTWPACCAASASAEAAARSRCGQSAAAPAGLPGGRAGVHARSDRPAHAYRGESANAEQNILGIATLHRTLRCPPARSPRPPACRATAGPRGRSIGAAVRAVHAPPGSNWPPGDGVSQHRLGDGAPRAPPTARSHLGATRVTSVALTPFAPSITEAASSAGRRPAA